MQTFTSSIEKHPLLIYYVALPFTPVNTLLLRTFNSLDIPQIVGGYNASWPQLLHMFHGHNARVLSVAFVPNGERIVSSSADHMIRIWDASSGEEILTMEGHEGTVHSVAVSHDGQWIVSGSRNCSICLWNVSSGSEVLPQPLQGHTDAVSSVAFSQIELKSCPVLTTKQSVCGVPLQVPRSRFWEATRTSLLQCHLRQMEGG
jgi:WD40 repeat protein